jgi:predicted dehydrogenase
MPKSKPLGVGIIGTGNISGAYLRLAPRFKDIKVVAVADMAMAAAEAKAKEHNVKAQSVGDLLKNDDVDIVLNLTIPAAHFDVSKQCLEAGKHVYSEKPVVLSLADGKKLQELAAKKNLKVASAPDTFMGGSHQQVRALVDEGKIGKLVSATMHFMGPGMEGWHPNPDFFFQPGGGPVLDMGPYYITALINLIGPVTRVAALSGAPRKTRTVTTPESPKKGSKIDVNVDTTVHALMEFASGAMVTFGTSWDVYSHKHQCIELYGTEGAMFVPDPNFFGDTVHMAGTDGVMKPVDAWDHPLGVINDSFPHGKFANYRSAGLADLAVAIREGRDARCGLDRALHAVEVMTAILESGKSGKFVDLTTTCTRPEAFGIAEAKAMLA